METRTVTFDLWNTLIENKDYNEMRKRFLVHAIEAHSANREQIESTFTLMHEHALKEWETPPYRFFTNFKKIDFFTARLGIRIQDKERDAITRYFEECILESPPQLHAGVKETLEWLRPRYAIALVSDTGYTPGSVMRRILAGHGILDLFDTCVFSDEIGYNKPHPSMFKKALDDTRSVSGHAIHVGDMLRTDIAGAKGAGMRAVWVDRGKKDSPVEVTPDFTIKELPDLVPILDR